MRVQKRLLSPDLWIAVLSLLALLGALTVAIGLLFRSSVLVRAGVWLGVPLVLVGVVTMVIIIPTIICLNRK
jgi:hypothetical protein